jgi:transcriptional regulator with XRE-family HTH domain
MSIETEPSLFARALKVVRSTRKISQGRLAEIAGIARAATISDIETGASGGEPETKAAILRALDLTEDALIRESGLVAGTSHAEPMGLEMVKAAVSAVLDERGGTLSIEEERLLWLFRNDDAFKSAISAVFEKRLRMNQEKLPARLRGK